MFGKGRFVVAALLMMLARQDPERFGLTRCGVCHATIEQLQGIGVFLPSDEIAHRIGSEERLDRAFRAIAGGLTGNLLDGHNKIRIKRKTSLPERHHGNCAGILRRGRQYSCAGPRGFTARLCSVENTHTHAGPRKFPSNGRTDQASARDRDVEALHVSILQYETRSNASSKVLTNRDRSKRDAAARGRRLR